MAYAKNSENEDLAKSGAQISPIRKPKKGLKHLAGLLAALTVLSGGISLYRTSQKTDSSAVRDFARETWLQKTVYPQKSPITLTEMKTPFHVQKVGAFQGNLTCNDIFKIFQNIAPKHISAERLQLCAKAFQTLTTSSDGLCVAYQIPTDSCTKFLEMALCFPKGELEYLANNEIGKMLFPAEVLEAKRILCKNPGNVEDFAQCSFECSSCYKTYDAMVEPLKRHENDTSYIYWDSVSKPTISKGINLAVHDFILPHIRIQNSSELQEILHPKDIKSRSNDPYIVLSQDNLQTLTEHVIQSGETNHKARYFQKHYQLNVHPKDKPLLNEYFRILLAQAVHVAARDMGDGTQERGGGLLFGTYNDPLPLGAAKVAADISYRGGGIKGSPAFREAYIARDWPKVLVECIPASGKPKDRCAWRQGLIKDIIDKDIVDKDKSWIQKNKKMLSLLALGSLATGVGITYSIKRKKKELE